MLSLYQKSLFLLTVTVIRDTSSLTPISKEVQLTLYTDEHNWNEAQAVCESIGGNLFSLQLAEKGVVLDYYMDSPEWSANKDVWVGLHYPALESASNYGWMNCVSLSQLLYVHWKQNEPKNAETSRCIVADKNWKYWKSKPCDDDSIFLCEKTGVDCTFRSSNERPVTSSSYETTVLTVADMVACRTNCLTQTQNNKNCWAVNWHTTGSNNCELHFTDNPFFFVSPNVVADGSERLMVKECYSFSVVTSASTPSQSNTDPVEGCPAFDTTTTSTTTTTTTVTTTTTPTTTSTTTTTPTTTSTTTTTPTTTTPTTTSTTTTTPTTTTTTPSTTTTTPTTTTTTPTTTTTTPTTTTTTPTTTTTTPTTTTTTPTTTTTTPTTTTTTPTTTTTNTPTTTSTTTTTPTTTSTTTTTPTTTPTTASTPTTTSTTQTTTATTQTTTSLTTSALTTSTTTSTPPSTTTTTPTSSTTSTTPTSVPTTTTPTSPTTTSPFSSCKCSCSRLNSLLSTELVGSSFLNLTTAEKVAVLQLRLKQDVNKLSSTIRKKSSAKDSRPQSTAVGFIGVTFLCVIFVPIVLSDTIKVLVFMYEYLKQKSSVVSTNES